MQLSNEELADRISGLSLLKCAIRLEALEHESVDFEAIYALVVKRVVKRVIKEGRYDPFTSAARVVNEEFVDDVMSQVWQKRTRIAAEKVKNG